MEIGSVLLGAALLILVGLFLARPFLISARYGNQRTLRQELLTQKEAVLAQIQVLEFDFETGTLPEADYERQRRQLVEEAAHILKKMDEIPAAFDAAGADKTDKEIEAAVARLRKRSTRPAAAKPAKTAPKPKPLPVPVQPETIAPSNGRVKFCSQCGQSVEESDNFCAYCGQKIHQPHPS